MTRTLCAKPLSTDAFSPRCRRPPGHEDCCEATARETDEWPADVRWRERRLRDVEAKAQRWLNARAARVGLSLSAYLRQDSADAIREAQRATR
jgi:hypothetical protein